MRYLPTPCGRVVQVQGDQALVLTRDNAVAVLRQLHRWLTGGIQDPEYRAQHVASARHLVWALEEIERAHAA